MKAFISYKEGKETIEGIFELVEQTPNYIKFRSKDNIITVPYHKINKVKIKDTK